MTEFMDQAQGYLTPKKAITEIDLSQGHDFCAYGSENITKETMIESFKSSFPSLVDDVDKYEVDLLASRPRLIVTFKPDSTGYLGQITYDYISKSLIFE